LGQPLFKQTLIQQDPNFFPNAGAIREIFSHFGPVARVTIIPGPSLTALLAFEHKVCAEALINSNGMNLGGRPIYTKSIAPTLDQILQPSKTPSSRHEGSSPEARVSSSPVGTPTPSSRAAITALRPKPSPVIKFDPFRDEPQPLVKLNAKSQVFVPNDGIHQDSTASFVKGNSKLIWC
jgi:hypothetical protein